MVTIPCNTFKHRLNFKPCTTLRCPFKWQTAWHQWRKAKELKTRVDTFLKLESTRIHRSEACLFSFSREQVLNFLTYHLPLQLIRYLTLPEWSHWLSEFQKEREKDWERKKRIHVCIYIYRYLYIYIYLFLSLYIYGYIDIHT